MGGKRVKDEEKTKKQKGREHSKRGKDHIYFILYIYIYFLIPFKYDFLISIDYNKIMFIKAK